MFSGIQEMIVLLVIVFFIFLIPNFWERKKNLVIPNPYPKISVKLKYKVRLFILGSVIWLSFFIILIRPWEQEKLLSYTVWGIGPVVLFWGICWVNAGDK